MNECNSALPRKTGDVPQFRKETVEVAKSCLDARPPGAAKWSATTEFDIAVSFGKLGPLGPEQMTWTVQPLQQP